MPWAFRVSWIKSLKTSANNICSPVHLKSELESIKRYATWNYFPKYATNNIMKKAINKIISNDG